jgi:FixJ family two-component response regulator
MGVTPLIAVIDDEKGVLDALCSLVRSLGFEAMPCNSAEEFLAAADLGRVACIVTDLSMPGMGGIGLKRVLDTRCPTLPVIMMTGRREPTLLASAAALKPAGLFQKPVDPGELCACLLAAVDPGGAATA